MPASLNPFRALRHRNFLLFWSGQTLSLIGTWMQSMAEGWLAFELTRKLPAYERQRILRKCAELIRAQREDLARTLALEAGKPIRTARGPR